MLVGSMTILDTSIAGIPGQLPQHYCLDLGMSCISLLKQADIAIWYMLQCIKVAVHVCGVTKVLRVICEVWM